MKRALVVILILACIAIGAVLYLFVHSSSKTASPPGASAVYRVTNSADISSASSSGAGEPTKDMAGAPGAQVERPETASAAPPTAPFILGSPGSPPPMDPATVLGNMRIVINQYASMFGGNPVGTNPEITKALNGGNPKQARLINEESGLRINGRGELVDYWGTPFFFHQLSGTEMEIRTAGPDRQMWTSDDLVTK